MAVKIVSGMEFCCGVCIVMKNRTVASKTWHRKDFSLLNCDILYGFVVKAAIRDFTKAPCLGLLYTESTYNYAYKF